MKLTMPSLRATRRHQLDLINAQLSGIGATLSLLCKLTTGEITRVEPRDEDEGIPEPAEVPARLYLVT